MKIKKFIASSLQEAVAKMKAEMGDEAVILSSGLLSSEETGNNRRMFEVIAALEAPTLPSVQNEESQADILRQLREKSARRFPAAMKSAYEELEKEAELPPSTKPIRRNPLPPATASKISKTYSASDDFNGFDDDEIEANLNRRSKKSDIDLQSLKSDLLDRDILPPIVKRIIDQITKQAPFMNSSGLDEYVVSVIASMVQVASFGVRKGKENKVIAVVGPTGVGKTTFISKLAVISKIIHNLDIGIITLDTYRLGALDQLKVFSQLSNIDFLVGYEPSDLPKLLTKFKKKDVVFIDTAGRSQNNPTMLTEIKTFLSTVKINETFLVLNSASSTKNLFDIAKKFAPLKYTSLVITKLDESASFGNILNLSVKFNTPIKFFTNGQVIPDDIIAADADFVANLIYSGKLM